MDQATGSELQTDFVVRFMAAEQILASDSSAAKCSASKRGLPKCKVKKAEPVETGNAYKYVVQAHDTKCAVLHPRLYVN